MNGRANRGVHDSMLARRSMRWDGRGGTDMVGRSTFAPDRWVRLPIVFPASTRITPPWTSA